MPTRGIKASTKMYPIAAIGLLTILLSLVMIASPRLWSRGILSFSEKPYFHVAEIFSRLLLGGVLILYSGETLYPVFIQTVGGVFLFAGAFLIIAGPRRHREFAVRSSTFVKIFRPAGVASLVFGAFIVYVALSR